MTGAQRTRASSDRNADILGRDDILLNCQLEQYMSLPGEQRTAIYTKLKRLAKLKYQAVFPSLPDRAYLLFWRPRNASSDTSLSDVFSPSELRRMRINLPTSTDDSIDSTAPSVTCEHAYILGYCVIGHQPPSDDSLPHYSIDYFEVLCPGHNVGQLLYQRAGQQCAAADAARRADPAPAAPTDACASAADDGSRPGPPTHLASWPLPKEPVSIDYWMKLEERTPGLGPGGFMRVFRQVTLASGVPDITNCCAPHCLAAIQAAAAGGSVGLETTHAEPQATGPHSHTFWARSAFGYFAMTKLKWTQDASQTYLGSLDRAASGGVPQQQPAPEPNKQLVLPREAASGLAQQQQQQQQQPVPEDVGQVEVPQPSLPGTAGLLELEVSCNIAGDDTVGAAGEAALLGAAAELELARREQPAPGQRPLSAPGGEPWARGQPQQANGEPAVVSPALLPPVLVPAHVQQGAGGADAGELPPRRQRREVPAPPSRRGSGRRSKVAVAAMAAAAAPCSAAAASARSALPTAAPLMRAVAGGQRRCGYPGAAAGSSAGTRSLVVGVRSRAMGVAAAMAGARVRTVGGALWGTAGRPTVRSVVL